MDTHDLLHAIDLRALAEEAGAEFRGKGNSSRCPLHGGTNPAAFHLYRGGDGGWRWHCFTNCPKGANDGDAFTFVMRWRGVDFKTAVAQLRVRSGQVGAMEERCAAPVQSALRDPQCATPGPVWQAKAESFVRYAEAQLWGEAGARAREYLMEVRGLADVTLATHRIGFNPVDWRDRTPARWGLADDRPVWGARGIVIPTFVAGAPVFVNVRRPLPGDGLAQRVGGAVTGLKAVKYVSIRGGGRRLFLGDYIRGMEALLLCEGEFDALLAWQELGDLVDVASIGGARMRLRMDDAVRMLGARRILAAYDQDAAGDAGREALAALSERVVRVRPRAHDLTEMYGRSGALGLRWWLEEVLGDHRGCESEGGGGEDHPDDPPGAVVGHAGPERAGGGC